jgi:protein-L-isoaspartate(D-aspartate) O-methyltransferase
MVILKEILFWLLVYSFLFCGAFSQDRHQKLRYDMVKYQIEDRGVKDKLVLEAMRKVKRHEFVPGKHIDDAYKDHPLPIGYGQTISQPYIVALMTELADVKPGEKVLEIGTGSGYQAAVLAEITDSVFTIEIVKELGESAKSRIAKIGYENTQVKIADGYYGWKEFAPFDAIIVTAAAEHIPPPLIEQLKDGGKMVIPVGHPYQVQNLMLVEKKDGKIKSKNIIPVRFVPFTRGK